MQLLLLHHSHTLRPGELETLKARNLEEVAASTQLFRDSEKLV